MWKLQGHIKRGHEAESRPARGTVGQSSGRAENSQVEDTEQRNTKKERM